MKDENKTKDELMNELIVLRQRISELEESGAEYKELEQALQKERHDLGERVKELNCLYGISSLAEKQNISLEEMLQGGVDLIPLAWQYPEITCARITLENQTFRTKNYKDSIWKQSASITLHGNLIGTLEVCYLEEKPESDEGPFLKEEKGLINAIATQLIKIIEREWAEEQITHLNAILRAVRNVNQLIAREKDRHRLLQGACENLTETRGYYNAWIAFMDDSGRVVAGAEAALGKEFLPMLEQLKRGQLTNCAGRALGEPGVVAIEDPFSSCVNCPLREKYYGRGAMTVRLESPWGKIHGLLCVSLPTNMAKNKEEQSLFQEVARDIAFALYNIELEEERKRAEEALKKSEEKFKTFMETATDLMHMADKNGNLTYVNKAMAKTLGYSKEEMIGMHITQLLTKEALEKNFKPNCEKYITEGKMGVETIFATKDGKEIYGEMKAVAVYDSDRKYAGARAIFRDLTERKKMEEMLVEERDLLQALIDNIPDCIYFKDDKHRFIRVNKALAESLDTTPENMMRKTDFDFFPQEQAKGTSADEIRVMKSHKPLVNRVEKITDAGGMEHWFSVTKIPRHNERGEVIGTMGISRDITELKKAKEELEQSRSHFQMLFNVMADPVVIVDGKGEFLEITNRVQEITGFKREELLGKNFMRINIVTARSKAILTKNLAKRMMRMKIAPYEVEVLTKDGEKIPCEVNATRINYMGKPADMVVFRNITERKKAEKRIREYAQELTVRNEQLEVETEKAKESDRLKSEFLANMSHEIRTPLTAIKGAAYLLDKSSLSSEQKKLCSIIGQSGEQLLQIINNILDLALVEAGEVGLEEKEFSLKETLKRIISGLKLQAKEKGLELKMILPPDLPSKILSDEGKLIHIVSNLISNALKFTERGKVELRVKKLAHSKIQILVKDTGIGIPKEKLSMIFNKFEQVNGTIRRKYGGTGLGLTIVKELVKVLGGKIEVTSELGKGSTFSFSFAYRLLKQREVSDKDQAKLKPKIKKKTKKDINILIAEDDDFGYYIIERSLEDYTITRVKDGKDALEKIKKKSYDLVLMDIQMPKMDGLEATRKIREKDFHLPIIALTAKAMKGDKEKCLEAGCSDYISKPITPDELIAKVNQYSAKSPLRK